MDVLFAIEAGAVFGLGHYMRCRCLANELHRRGRTMALVLRGDAALTHRWPWPGGTAVIAAPDDVDVAAETVLALSDEHNPRWTVIDGYGFAGSALLGKLREVKRPTLVIDDISDKSLIADIVLNQNVQDSTLYVDRAPGATLLLGPQFALIADAFRAARANGDAADAISGVLVSFGGSDLRGMTPHVLRCLEDSPADIKRIDVVVGPYHAQSRCGTSLRPAIYYHVGTENLCPLMARADVVVSSSGTSCWEACCLGRPLIAVQTVKNQREVAATLRRSGAALTLDATDGFSDDDFAVAWRDVQPVGVRNRLAATARDLVDGLGQGRVADALGF